MYEHLFKIMKITYRHLSKAVRMIAMKNSNELLNPCKQNYHEVYGHLPKAVLSGLSGGSQNTTRVRQAKNTQGRVRI